MDRDDVEHLQPSRSTPLPVYERAFILDDQRETVYVLPDPALVSSYVAIVLELLLLRAPTVSH